jgi:hypothetical protein
MTQQEHDEMVIGIARRVLSEKESGRKVDPIRLAWATGVLDIAEHGRPEPARVAEHLDQGAAA